MGCYQTQWACNLFALCPLALPLFLKILKLESQIHETIHTLICKRQQTSPLGRGSMPLLASELRNTEALLQALQGLPC